jgi:VWFA-related protein
MIRKLAGGAVCAEILFLGIALVLDSPTPTSAQEMSRSQEALVSRSVILLGHKNQPVTGLNSNEVEVFLGKEQIPIEALNRPQSEAAEIGILVDTSNSRRDFLQSLHGRGNANARPAIMHTGDRAFVATFSNSHRLLCPLTTDSAQVKVALQTGLFEVPPGGVTSVYDAIEWACREEFSTQPGIKVLIVISDMLDNNSNHSRQEAVAPAADRGIQIDPITPPEVLGSSSLGDVVAKFLASVTGGIPTTIENSAGLEPAFEAIRSTIDSTYTISFRPESARHSSLKIRCTRKGIRVVAPELEF